MSMTQVQYFFFEIIQIYVDLVKLKSAMGDMQIILTLEVFIYIQTNFHCKFK